MSVRLILISHASTSAVREVAFPADEPIDPQGQAKASALAGELRRVDAAWTSPALRATQTATACNLRRRSILRSGILTLVTGRVVRSLMFRNLTPMGSRHGSVRAMQRHTEASRSLTCLSGSQVGSMCSNESTGGSWPLPIPPSSVLPLCLGSTPSQCPSGVSTLRRFVVSAFKATLVTGRCDQ
jgi:phosphohistidine phosphatase SixA